MTTIQVIYLGDHFYQQSKSLMSSLYTDDGRRFDLGGIKCALSNGQSVNIRPATQAELEIYEAKFLVLQNTNPLLKESA